jgi:hypothetical protein
MLAEQYMGFSGPNPMKVILRVQSNDSLIDECTKYFTDTIGPLESFKNYFCASDGVAVCPRMWSTLRTPEAYVEHLVTLMCYCDGPEGTDFKAWLKRKLVTKQYKDSRVVLFGLERLPA